MRQPLDFMPLWLGWAIGLPLLIVVILVAQSL